MLTNHQHAHRLRARTRRLSQTLSPQTLLVGAVLIVIGYLAVVPLAFLAYRTFFEDGGFTLGGFARAYDASSDAWPMIVNSLVFAVGSTLVCLTIGGTLAYVQARTDAPFRGLIFAASLVPLVIPGILYSAAWIFLADRRVGILNTLILEPIFGRPLLDIYTMPGMIWVQGAHQAPIAFLFMAAAFRVMDPSLEESALMSGARRSTVVRRITLPLLRPAMTAAALLLFVQALESFEVPAVLGLEGGNYVFTSRIYFVLRSFPADYPAAGAYSLGLLFVAAIGALLASRLSKDGRKFQTISGKAFRPRAMPLGEARPYVGLAVCGFFAVTILLPLIVLVYMSLLPFFRPISWDAFSSFSLDGYRKVMNTPGVLRAFKNTFILAIVSATVVMFLTSVASWVVVRTKARGRRLIDMIALSPLVIPGLVLGLSVSFVYLRSPLPVYGTLWILLLAYVTKYLPYGMRYASSGMTQISAELEESAQVCGAPWWKTFTRVLVPLAGGSVLAGWTYIMIISFRELSSTVLLYSPGSETVSIKLFEFLQSGRFTEVGAIGVVMIMMLIIIVGVTYRLGKRFAGMGQEQP